MATTLFSRVFGTGTPFARWTGALRRWYQERTGLVIAVNIVGSLVQLTVWFALLAGFALVAYGVSIALLGFPFLIAGVRGPIQPYLQSVWGRTAFWAVLLVLRRHRASCLLLLAPFGEIVQPVNHQVDTAGERQRHGQMFG